MKYYSRSPEQISNLSQSSKNSIFSKKKLASLILFADFLLILLILVYFLGNVPEKGHQKEAWIQSAPVIKKDNIVEKEFSVSEGKINSYCEIKKGCRVEMDFPQKTSFKQIKWLVWRNDTNSASHNFYKYLDNDQKLLKENFGFPLEATETVFMSLSGNSDKEIKIQGDKKVKGDQTDGSLKFQIYP